MGAPGSGSASLVIWSRVRESVTGHTLECRSCLNAELTRTQWGREEGGAWEAGAGEGWAQGRGGGQRRGFHTAIGLGRRNGVHPFRPSPQKKQNKKTQTPCQTERAMMYAQGTPTTPSEEQGALTSPLPLAGATWLQGTRGSGTCSARPPPPAPTARPTTHTRTHHPPLRGAHTLTRAEARTPPKMNPTTSTAIGRLDCFHNFPLKYHFSRK